jgi:hypothetical protein
MLKVEVEAVEPVDVVVLSHGEVFSTPNVPQPEPHPERRSATKNAKAIETAFMCPEEISISILLAYVPVNRMLPQARQFCCAASLEITLRPEFAAFLPRLGHSARSLMRTHDLPAALGRLNACL